MYVGKPAPNVLSLTCERSTTVQKIGSSLTYGIVVERITEDLELFVERHSLFVGPVAEHLVG